MLGLMQRYPLLISSLIVHAARHRGESEVVSNLGGPTLHRTTYAEVERRSRRLARALGKLGVGFGDRVATLAWNDFRHLELYYGVSGMGAVCHTVNPRLSVDDIAFIMTDAEDRILFADPSFAALLAEIAPAVSSSIRAVVLLTNAAGMRKVALAPGVGLHCYETLLAEADEDYAWPEFDENTASALCYTSGTTGRPKGVSTATARRCCTLTQAIPRRRSAFARSIACCPPRRCITLAHGVCLIAQPWWARRSFCPAGLLMAFLL